jgi:protein TonB
MLRPLTDLFARSTTWTASLAIHAGLALAGGRALSGPTTAESPPIEVELAWEAPPSPAPAVDATEPWNVLAHVSAHTHPHDADQGARPHDPSLVHAPAHEVARPEPPADATSLDATPHTTQQNPPVFVLTVAGMRAKTETSELVATHAFGAGEGGGAGGGASQGTELGGAGPVLAESAVDVPARLLARSTVEYPAEARAGGVEADVPVEIVLDERGTVTSSRALSRAGYGFDDAALRAVRQLRFTPALRAGRAVRVRMRWPVVFRLR